MNLEKLKIIFQSKPVFENYIYRTSLSVQSKEDWRLRFETLKRLRTNVNQHQLSEDDLRKAEFQTQASIFDSKFDQDLSSVYAAITEKLDSPSAPEHKIKFLKKNVLEIENVKNLVKKLLVEGYHASVNFDFSYLEDLLPVTRLMYEGVDSVAPCRLVSEFPEDIMKLAERVMKNSEHIQKVGLEIMKCSKEEDFYIQTLQSSLIKLQDMKISILSMYIPLIVETGYGLEQKEDDIILIEPDKKENSRDEFEVLMSEMRKFSTWIESNKTYAKTVEPPIAPIRNLENDIVTAKTHLSFLTGLNSYKEKIMSQQDYDKLVEYVYYLIAHNAVPKIDRRFPQLPRVSNDSIRFTIYLIHRDIFGTKDIRNSFIDFIHRVFIQFDGTEKSTTKKKFSSKPKRYPF